MRLFIGIFLTEDLKKEVIQIQSKLKKLDLFNGKFAESENLHLTLKFLGEVDKDKVKDITKSLSEIKGSSFNSKLDQLGIFTPANPKILWIHIGGAEELQKSIDEKMKEMGFKEEEKFMSHLTIARIKQMNKTLVKKLFEEMRKITMNNEFKVEKFALIESILTSQGPEYKIVKEFKLN